MAELLRIAATVGTPIAAVSVIVVVALYAYRAKLKSQHENLNSLPKNKRAEAVDEYLTRYGIHGKDLPGEQRFVLIQDEMAKRHRRSFGHAILVAVVVVVCVSIASIAYVLVSNGGEKSAKPTLSGGNNPVGSTKRKLDKPPDENKLPRPPT